LYCCAARSVLMLPPDRTRCMTPRVV
jgi:hypothetical protein